MVRHLHTITDAAFESLKPSYESVLDKLNVLKEEWNSADKECGSRRPKTKMRLMERTGRTPSRSCMTSCSVGCNSYP